MAECNVSIDKNKLPGVKEGKVNDIFVNMLNVKQASWLASHVLMLDGRTHLFGFYTPPFMKVVSTAC